VINWIAFIVSRNQNKQTIYSVQYFVTYSTSIAFSTALKIVSIIPFLQLAIAAPLCAS
jgi:hypothetical protein